MKLPKMGQAAPGNYLLYDQMVDEIEKGLNVAASIDVSAGGTITLTETQATQNLVVELTGAPAADFTVQYADGQKRAQIFLNSTAKNATIKTAAGGSTGIVVSPNTGDFLVSDGTNVKAYLSQDIMRLATTSVDGASDWFAFWDTSAGGLRRVLGDNLPGSGGGGGVVTPAVVQEELSESPITPDNTANEYVFDVSQYSEVIITLDGVGFAAADTTLIRASTDGGVSFKSGATDYTAASVDSGADAKTSTDRGFFGDGTGTTDHDGVMRFSNIHAGRMTWHGLVGLGNSAVARAGFANFDGPVTHIKVYAASGNNFNAGTIRAVGITALPAPADARGALVYPASDQTIATATWTAIAHDTEEYDSDAIHDTVTNNSRLTVPAGVTKVQLSATLAFQTTSTTGLRVARITKNGATVVGYPLNSTPGAAASGNINLISPVLTVTPGDYFELEAFQDSGGNLDTNAANSTWFAMEIVETKIVRPIHRGALVKHSANQSIPHNTITALAFDQEAYDTDALHDTVTNNSRLTVPAGVTKVRLKGNVNWDTNGTGDRRLFIDKNGAGTAYDGRPHSVQPGDAGNGAQQNVASPVLTVTPGDYFEVAVQQTSGGALNALASNTWFEMEIIE